MNDSGSKDLPPLPEMASSLNHSQQPATVGTPYAYIYTLSDPRDGAIRYVGKSFDWKERFKVHLSDKSKSHKANWIKSLKKSGLLPICEVIEEIQETDDFAWGEAERFWISTFRFYGFNLTNQEAGGISGKRHSIESRAKMSRSQTGKTHVTSEETKAKISASLMGHGFSQKARDAISRAGKGRKPTLEQRKKLSEAQKGRKWSQETRVKMLSAWKGRKHSIESKLRMSDSQKKRFHKNCVQLELKLRWNKRKLSPEHRKSLSYALMKRSDELKQRFAKIRIGAKASEETRLKMSKSQSGRIVSAETRAKVSIAVKNRPQEIKDNFAFCKRGKPWPESERRGHESAKYIRMFLSKTEKLENERKANEQI